MDPIENYGSLMRTIRSRFETIEALRQAKVDSFSRAESAAFHGRKIIEAIAFCCLVALDNGIKNIPRDAKGQWNAECIFKKLKTKNLNILPSPSVIRPPTDEEINKNHNVKATIEGVPNRRLSYDNLIEIYQGLHAWLHEINPYSNNGKVEFYSRKSDALWKDLERLHLFIESHFISINGSGFFCVLKDKHDGQTKVTPLNKQLA